MIKGTNRKEKIDALKGLLNGNKTVKDLVQAAGAPKISEYADCSEEPGVYYDRKGHQYTEAEVRTKDEHLKARGFLVWSETRTYKTKEELHGFFEA